MWRMMLVAANDALTHGNIWLTAKFIYTHIHTYVHILYKLLRYIHIFEIFIYFLPVKKNLLKF